MKRLFLFSSLFILSLCTCGPALLAQANIPASYPVDFISKFQDIHVDADGVGFAGGHCGVLRKTVTDGQMWETVESPVEGTVSVIACPPSGCATALLYGDQKLYRLNNDVWTDTGLEEIFVNNLHWLTDDVIVNESGGDFYQRSADGGLTWTTYPLATFQRANMVFTDENTALIWVGMELYKSTDAALTFTSVGYTHPTNVSKQTWLNEQEGWIFSSDRLFYATTDGGQSWTLLNEESQLTSVNWMEALSATHLVGAQITTSRLESLDGGLTWTRTPFLEEGNRRVNERYHRRGDEFFTVGDASQLMYSPAGFTDFVELDAFPRTQGIDHLAVHGNNEVYAAAGRELLISTDGVTWAVNQDFGFSFIRDLATLDDGSVVVLFSDAAKISSDNGLTFTDWVPLDLVPGNQHGIVFSQKPNGDYYLLGAEYATSSTDGGATWAAINHASELSFHGVFWITDDIGYTFTRQEHFAKTTDGGQSWTVGAAPVRNLEGIYFTDEMNGWVSRANDRYFTSDGGASWTTAAGEGGYNYQEHPEDGSILVARYLGGNNGEISRSTDGGQSWRNLNFNCYAYRAGVVSDDGQYFWTGGDGGFIVRHDLDALIEAAAGTGDRSALQYVNLHATPNPTDGLVTVTVPELSADGRLEVYDLSGRRVQSISVPRGTTQQAVDLTEVPAGVYVVRWLAGGQAGRVKLVKR